MRKVTARNIIGWEVDYTFVDLGTHREVLFIPLQAKTFLPSILFTYVFLKKINEDGLTHVTGLARIICDTLIK